jgi:hypothetical protein
VNGGTILIRGCEFREGKPQVELAQEVRRAVITENIFTGKPQISNNSKYSVILTNNASDQ